MNIKKTLKQHAWKEDFVWNQSICACERDKICKNDEYLNNCAFSKHAVDTSVATCEIRW